MRRVLRALASVLGLAAAIAGLPALLVGVVGWPLPHGLPALSELRNAVGDGWRPGERFVLGVLAVVAWALWAQLLRHLVVEVRLRRPRGPATPGALAEVAGRGPSRRLAAWLVGGVMLAGPLTTAAVAVTPRIPVVLSATRALDAPDDAPALAPPEAPRATEASPTYRVHTWEERRDCLWTIAGRYVGDPLRWGELLELNADVRQPSGRRLVDDPQHWVYPGMELRLPADAAGPDVVVAPPPAAAPTAHPSSPVGPAGDSPAPMLSTAAEPAPAAPASSPLEAEPFDSPTTAAPIPGAQPAPASTGGEVAPPSSAQPPPEAGPPIRLGRSAMLVAQALALGLPVFAAGGLVRHLNRRRRAQLAHHRPGRDIVRPDPASEPLERKARAIAVDEAAEWVDATLRVLGGRIREASLPAPAITCVRAGQCGLEILLAEARTSAPVGFDAVDEGFVWRVGPDTDLDDLRAEAARNTATAPALVSVGASPEGPLLVDLEGVGTLSVEGAPDRVAAFLAGVAVELACAPWAEGIDLRLVGPHPGLAGVEAVSVVDDSAILADQMAALAARSADALGPGVTTLAGRVADADEPWFPTVVVVGASSSPAELGCMAEAARPGSGVVLVAPGPVAGATWRLVVVDDGHARLEPLGLVVRASGAPAPIQTEVGDLDPDIIAAAAGLLSAASHDDDIAPVVDASPPADVATEVTPRRVATLRRRPYDVWVSVLGPVQTSGWAKAVGQRSKFEEVLAYLATHRRPVPGEDVRAAVWPDTDLDPKSFREAMSRVRACLGREAGHLPNAVAGAYPLGESVGCDWPWFLELSAAAAAHSDPAEAIALWREALELVRGQPFGGGLEAGRPYGWAYSEFLVYDMQREITTAADALAGLALANDDPDTTRWAVRQGHLATPGQLSLFDWEMRVARHRLDADALKLARNARRRAEQELDPGADLPAETVALYERLLAEITEQAAPGRRATVRS